MSEKSTLFDDGLVKSDDSSQPKMPKKFIDIIEKGWDERLVNERTKKAIEYISRFIPGFKNAKITKTPLFGTQQIPGNDSELRATEVFIANRYAKCEIVKASSIIEMVKVIKKELEKYNITPKKLKLDENELERLSCELAQKRDYPQELGKISFRK